MDHEQQRIDEEEHQQYLETLCRRVERGGGDKELADLLRYEFHLTDEKPREVA